MSALLTQLELLKLSRELEVSEESLQFLADHDAAEISALRTVISEHLHSRHAARFDRLASLSKLVPVAISARAASMVGPVMSARVAAALDPDQAIKLARAMKPAQLAEVTVYLDPAKVAPIVAAMPDEIVVAVARELIDSGDFLTLGRFTAVVDPSLAVQAAAEATGAQLLALALFTEDRGALDAIVDQIDDGRLDSAVRAAAAKGDLEEALALIAVLSPSNRVRVMNAAADLDLDDRTALVKAVISTGSWPLILGSLGDVAGDQIARLINVPATLTAEVWRQVIAVARELDHPDYLEPVVVELDPEHVEALLRSGALRDPEVIGWVRRAPTLRERLGRVVDKLDDTFDDFIEDLFD